MKKRAATTANEKRYARLRAQAAKLGPILQGTITERIILRDDPKRPGKKKTYGPYYQWTFKEKGKTVTVNLSAAQAKTYRRAIEHHRKMETIIQEMRALSRQILDAKTKGVKKRNSKP